MKRSEINGHIATAIGLLRRHGVALPPQADWDLRAWREHASGAEELARRGIGWDLTDFGHGDFARRGLVLYTLCNGMLDEHGRPADQPYANKLLLVGERQVTPTHHHWHKMEDIIVLGGGELRIRVHNVGPADALDERSDVRILCNNTWMTCSAGTVLALAPGERVRLDPGHYHSFWGEPGAGTVVVEEVSAVNDDHADNCFLPADAVGRFPHIEEDAMPRYLLCTELPGTRAFDRLLTRWLGHDETPR